jgi:penicillin-binding protein A
VLAVAGASFAVGAVVGTGGGRSAAQTVADSYARAWARRDYAAMYGELDPGSRAAVSPAAFASANEQALATATATHERVTASARDARGGEEVPVSVSTRLFGTLAVSFSLPVHQTPEGERVRWSASLAFPGLREGEKLSSRLVLPPRAALLARDGSVLAEGPSGAATAAPSSEAFVRSSPLGGTVEAVLGTVGPVPPSRRLQLEAEGVPADGLVGTSGLELALDQRLRGRPGGQLRAGGRLLATASSSQAAPVRTTISPALQTATVQALGGQYGGIVAMKPNGEILSVAGIGLNGLQPPGSTFKMVTVTAVLEGHVAAPRTEFPFATYATLDGVKLHNARGEECGGTLEEAFATSCNSVFSPLGAKVGPQRLVAMAERYGFNADAGIPGAARSTLPAAGAIQGELAVGSTAIGQGEVLATPLQMATVAATIADGGRRPRPTFLAPVGSPFVARASSSHVARMVRRLMIDVVRSGTGAAAAIPGVTVAGKTGTAELKSQQCKVQQTGKPAAGEGEAAGEHEREHEPSSSSEGREACTGTETEAANTDAWFAAFAPALHPRVVVCVMLVKDGAGGTTAAPVARQVIEAALQARV